MDFAALLLVPGVDARTMAAMVAEAAHGAPCRLPTPPASRRPMAARAATRTPCSTRVCDQTITVMKNGVSRARLDQQARALERSATGPTLPAFTAGERHHPHVLGGRSVSGWEPDPKSAASGG